MVSKITSYGVFGIEAYEITVEADISNGLPSFDIVGLPDAAVKESRDRVRSALKHNGFTFPVSRITVNLAPADLKKAGPLYDLPILVAILKASGQLDADTEGKAFLGELSLSGEVRAVTGILPIAIKALESGIRELFLPYDNSPEAGVVTGLNALPVTNVQSLFDHLSGKSLLECIPKRSSLSVAGPFIPDFHDVKGQSGAKRALEIAAAGSHNLLMIGPPGAGKSMLAKRLPSILPPMSFEESIETTKIHSVSGLTGRELPLVVERPFRSPHHTISPVGLSGGGTIPHPGELSLAHNGVLFLDELPEFSRSAMEVLRQPMEDGCIAISRASGTVTYPCNIMVIAAMNPCPCGYLGHPVKKCSCPPGAVSRYLGKVSGPLLDRLDLHLEVEPVEFEHLNKDHESERSADIAKRVAKARNLQLERYQNSGIFSNSSLKPNMLRQACPLSDKATALFRSAFDRLGLSARAYDRILKVSRTIADLEGSEVIESNHLAEALQYRNLDRKYWLSQNG